MATPSLAMIPSGFKAGKVYSVLPESGVGDFDFARATTATRVNSSGLIEEMAINVPRLEYPLIDGVVNGCPSLLLEPQRTNLITYSEDFSNAAWAKQNVTVTSDSVISPDGTLNADKITDDSTNGVHRITDSITTSSSGSFTYSIFLKKGTLTTAQFQVFNSTTASSANVDLVNGTITSGGQGSNHTIEDYGNDWFKCSISGTLSNTSTTVYLYLKQKPSYIGNGDYLYAWGAQLEQSSYPTSYIPTQGSAVTRVADACSGAGNDQVINSTEGVLFIETSALSDDLSERRFGLSDGTSSNVVRVGYTGISNRIIAVIYDGSNQAVMTYISSDITQNSKIAVKYKENDFALWVDGVERSTDASGSVFPANTLNSVNFNVGGGSHFYSDTKQIQYFDTALNDTSLEELTSWTSFNEMATAQQYTIQ